MIVEQQHPSRGLHDELERSLKVELAESKLVTQDEARLGQKVKLEYQVILFIGQVVE